MISLLNSVLPIYFNKTNNGKEKKKLPEAETETSQEEIPLLPKIWKDLTLLKMKQAQIKINIVYKFYPISS